MDVFEQLFGWTDTRTDEQKKKDEIYFAKIEEYKAHFGHYFDTESIIMTQEEIIKNIDKCLKHNRPWHGYIVPEVDYSDDVIF